MKWGILTALFAVSLLPVAAQGPVPKTKDGKPDFTGIWTSDAKTYANVGQVTLNAKMQKVYDERRSGKGKEKDPVARCLPTGVPRITAEPFKIMQTPDVVLMMFEGGTHSFRQFHLNTPHVPAAEWENNWMGHSIAKWEGDTLVVDTIGFNDLTWLNAQGLPHSEQLHVVERYTRPDATHLNVSITMEDPGAFTKPVTFARQHTLAAANREIKEYTCTEAGLRKQGLIAVH
jgi:hypothetical protein